MSGLSLRVTGPRAKPFLKDLAQTKRGHRRASVTAVNVATKQLVSKAVKAVSARTGGVQQKKIKRRLRVYRGARGDRTARTVWLGSRGFPLQQLSKARSVLRANAVSRGRFKIQARGSAFLATTPGGRRGVFVRGGPGGKRRKAAPRRVKRADGQWSTLPIDEVQFQIYPIAKKVLAYADRRWFPKFYQKEYDRQMRRYRDAR